MEKSPKPGSPHLPTLFACFVFLCDVSYPFVYDPPLPRDTHTELPVEAKVHEAIAGSIPALFPKRGVGTKYIVNNY